MRSGTATAARAVTQSQLVAWHWEPKCCSNFGDIAFEDIQEYVFGWTETENINSCFILGPAIPLRS